MRKNVLILFLMLLVVFTSVAQKHSDKKGKEPIRAMQASELTISNDSLTGLARKAVVSDVYFSIGVNATSDQVNINSQRIFVFYNVYTYGSSGQLLQTYTKRATFSLTKNDTTLFNQWSDIFNQYILPKIESDINEEDLDINL